MSIFDIQQPYFIESEFSSPAANIYFISTSHANQHWCIKQWKPNGDELYLLNDPQKSRQCLVRGFNINRLLARDVYMGIAQVFVKDNKEVFIKHFFANPPDILPEPEAGYEYALIMTKLENTWQLVNYCHPTRLQSIGGVTFLVQEVIRTQEKLALVSQAHSPYVDSKTYLEGLQKKLILNCNLFQKTLEQDELRQNLFSPCESIIPIMHTALKQLTSYLAIRYDNGRIQHCHGDLKISNLWIRPNTDGLEMLALDCVDFQPAFYIIDILSDAAMLAIDIQAHILDHLFQLRKDEQQPVDIDIHEIMREASIYVDTFLDAYLHVIHEQDSRVRSLWEFFITEKALVCSFMWSLYDKRAVNKEQPTIGNWYFHMALFHAHQLQKHLTYHISFPD